MADRRHNITRNRRVIVHNVPYFITCQTLSDPVIAVAALGQSVLDALSVIGARWGAELHAYVVMPDHWHALISTHEPHDISTVMDDAKTKAVFSFNRLSGHVGSIWQRRFYDHVCRDEEEFHRILSYVHHNPVEWELVDSPGDWPWSSWFAYNEGGEPPIPVVPIDGPFDSWWVEWQRHPPPRWEHPSRRHRRRRGPGDGPP